MKIVKYFKNIETNNKIAVKNTFFAFLIKGFSLIITFFTTPAFIKYFNNNVYLGVWYTLLAVLTWFLTFDFGIANGMRNQLVKDLSNNDRISAKKTISAGIFSNLAITIVLLIVGIIIISIIDLNWLYGIKDDSISSNVIFLSTLYVLFGIAVRFMLNCVSSLFYALQKASINNFLSLLTSILQFLFVSIYVPKNPENALISLSVAYILIANIPTFLAGFIVFLTSFKDCRPNLKFVEINSVKLVLNMGLVFFANQILYMLIVNSNELLISNLYGPQFTTEYSFYYKLSSLISMIVTLALTPLWSLITKAMNENNYHWIFKLYKVLTVLGVITIIIQFLFIFIEQFVMNIWLKEDSIKVDYYKAIIFAMYGGVFIYQTILSTIVCGMGRLKLQTLFYIIGVLIKFVLVILLHTLIDDWSFVVLTNVIILVPYCVAQQIDLSIFLRKKQKN